MVEDYSTPFFISAFVLCFMALFAVWAIWGLIGALVAGWVADRLINIDFRRTDDPR